MTRLHTRKAGAERPRPDLELVEEGGEGQGGRLPVHEVSEVIDHRHEVGHLGLRLQELRSTRRVDLMGAETACKRGVRHRFEAGRDESAHITKGFLRDWLIRWVQARHEYADEAFDTSGRSNEQPAAGRLLQRRSPPPSQRET